MHWMCTWCVRSVHVHCELGPLQGLVVEIDSLSSQFSTYPIMHHDRTFYEINKKPCTVRP